MFGRRRTEPEPPKRTVWADKTRVILDDVLKRRIELVRKLDDEEQTAKELCNHTFPNGTSAIEQSYDDEDDRAYSRCTVCGR